MTGMPQPIPRPPPPPLDLGKLQAKARAVRAATVRMAHAGRTSHVASALSCVDILVAVYFHSMRFEPGSGGPCPQDRFVLSKGHGCMAWFAALAERGFFPVEVLREYAQNGGRLAEHPSPDSVPGVEVATGSLGHGLSIGSGAALARRLDGHPGRAFVVLSDGECNEGSVWEAALFASRWQLDNLIAIIDYNKLQAMGRSNEVMALAPLADKWRAFGWETREVDGHDLSALASLLDAAPLAPGKPTAIVANTVKGKGVSFMEDDLEWHYRPPSADDLARALHEIEGS
jgi:transketolase